MVNMKLLLSGLKQLGMTVRAQAALMLKDAGNVGGAVSAFCIANAGAAVALVR